MKQILEKVEPDHRNCIMFAARYQLPFDSFKLLLEFCVQHADIKKMLEAVDEDFGNCIMIAARRQLPLDTLKLLIAFFPSKDSFGFAVAQKNSIGHSLLNDQYWEFAKLFMWNAKQMRSLLQNPQCWENCRNWFSEYSKVQLSNQAPARREQEED